jgi:hypothetical protein
MEFWKQFTVGSRVVYIGTYSPEKKGCYGTVVAKNPTGIMRAENSIHNINVLWDANNTYLGVFPENLELLDKEPEWSI